MDVQGTFDRTCTVQNGCILDSSNDRDNFTPVSQSPAWAMTSVKTSRPDILSSNAFLANAYAKTLWSAFLDMRESFDKDNDHRLYLVDIEPGEGKFSHLVLQALLDIRDRMPFRLESKLRYVLTSQNADQIQAWKRQPNLQSYLELGVLDFALWNPVRESTLTLDVSQRELSPTQPSAYPIFVLANQVLRHQSVDIFHIVEKQQTQVYELVEEYTSSSKKNHHDDFANEHVGTRAIPHTAMSEVYSASWSALLEWYVNYSSENTLSSRFPFPVSTLKMFENLKALAKDGHVVVLAADQGHYAPSGWIFDEFKNSDILFDDPWGQRSTKVNFHLLGLYCALSGGYALHTPQRDSTLSVSALVLMNHHHHHPRGSEPLNDERRLDSAHQSQLSRASSPLFHFAFQENFVRFTPHDFNVIVEAMVSEDMIGNADAGNALLTLLKLSRWDPDVFHRTMEILKSDFASLDLEIRTDLLAGLHKTERQAFVLNRDVDTYFDIAVVQYLSREYQRAIELYTESLRHFGAQTGTWYNIGLCHVELKQHQLAIDAFDEVLALDRNYAAASVERKKALAKLKKDEL